MQRMTMGSDTVWFGVGAEGALAEELAQLGAQRVLLVAQDRHAEGAERLAQALGARVAGTFLTTVPQVPGEVADAAVDLAGDIGADWLVAHGGGTPIGVAKAIALQLGLPIAAVPTTYAGSERTDIWGITRNGRKTTGRDPVVRPRLVAYDPSLFVGLPARLSHQSLLNALAHSLEALYATSVTPEALEAARDSLGPLVRGMRAIAADPSDLDGRTDALWGSFLASTALGGASMALHHKLAHVLGGSFGLPHAPTHATLLPWTFGYNVVASSVARQATEAAWGTDDPAAYLYDLLRTLGLDTSLAAIGFPADGPSRAAAEAMKASYDNPRPFTEAGLAELLTDAWLGRRPSLHTGRLAQLDAPAPHGLHAPAHRGPALADARQVVLAVHGRGSNAERFSHDLAQALAGLADVSVVAPQADGGSWYPRGFRAPVHDNQPELDSALAVLDATWAAIIAEVDPQQVVVVGFSQGACLALTWLSVTTARPASLLAFTGAHTVLPGATWAAAQGASVHLSRSAEDPWVPAEPFAEAVHALERAGAVVAPVTVAGATHQIHPSDLDALRRALEMP